MSSSKVVYSGSVPFVKTESYAYCFCTCFVLFDVAVVFHVTISRSFTLPAALAAAPRMSTSRLHLALHNAMG